MRYNVSYCVSERSDMVYGIAPACASQWNVWGPLQPRSSLCIHWIHPSTTSADVNRTSVLLSVWCTEFGSNTSSFHIGLFRSMTAYLKN